MNTEKRRSGIRIMGQLIGLVKPLLPVMLLAIVLGTIGYLCAIFLTILAGYGLMHILLEPLQESLGITLNPGNAGLLLGAELRNLFLALIVMAVMRGILHYGEQYCNHFIAFKASGRSYATRCSRRCGSSALRSWKEETREI